MRYAGRALLAMHQGKDTREALVGAMLTAEAFAHFRNLFKRS